MMRKAVLAFIICITAAMLTSCYDSNEADDLLHVIVLGMDRGVSDKLRLTVQFPTLKQGAGGGQSGGGGEEYISYSIDAPSFFTGIDMLNSTLARRLNFMHTAALIISEDMAKSGMMGESLSPILRFRQIRKSMKIIVTKGSAMDFIKAGKPVIGTTMSKNYETIFKAASLTGFFPDTTVNDFYDDMKSGYSQPAIALAAISKKESFKQDGQKWKRGFKTGGDYYAGELPLSEANRLELFGAAVFDGDKMVGELTGDETRMMQIISGEFKAGFFTFKDPKEPLSDIFIFIRQAKKPKVKVEFEGDKPSIHVKTELEGELLGDESRIHYEKLELKAVLEKEVEKEIEDGLDKVIEKCKGLKTDIFGLGRFVAEKFSTIQEWEEYDWMKQFKNAKINTEVKFTIVRTSTKLRNSPIITTEGKE